MIIEITMIGLLILFSWLGIKTNNPFIFMILFAVSIPLGLYLPDMASPQAETTGVDLIFGLATCMFGLLCAGWSLRLLLKSDDTNTQVNDYG